MRRLLPSRTADENAVMTAQPGRAAQRRAPCQEGVTPAVQRGAEREDPDGLGENPDGHKEIQDNLKYYWGDFESFQDENRENWDGQEEIPD